MRTLVRPGTDTDLIGLSLAALGDGEELTTEAGPETAVVVLSGTVAAAAGGADLGRAGSRSSVFDGPGHCVYGPPGTPLTLRAIGGPAEIAVATAPGTGGEPGPARVIGPDDQRVAEVGSGNWSRSVRTILGPEHAASRLLLGETINAPGNWSSYPPHRHDRHEPPEEVALEEVYLFKVSPGQGFGVQVRYDEAGTEEAFVVRDGDVAAIRRGFHPVVAAPGYHLYYLWVMAGQGRQMIPRLDPDHAWVQAS